MKKLTMILALMIALALVLAACGPNYDPHYDYTTDPYDPGFTFNDNDLWGDHNDPFGGNDNDWVNPDGNPDPALVALITLLYEGVDDVPMTMDAELTAANFDQFVFIDYIEGATGVVSQAVVSAIPHAVVLLQLPEGSDAAAVAAEIDEAADPARWICVEAEKASVFYAGNFVVFAMSFENVVDGVGANVNNVLA